MIVSWPPEFLWSFIMDFLAVSHLNNVITVSWMSRSIILITHNHDQCCPRWQFDNLADNNQYLQTLTIQPSVNLASDNGKHFFSRQQCIMFPACLGLGSSEYAGQDCCSWCQTVKGKMTNGSRCSENESWQRFCWISAKLFGSNETQNILVRSAKNIWMLSVNNTRSSTGW